MAGIAKIPLKMADGAAVKNLEDLRAHFDLLSILRYYVNGGLTAWLEDFHYDDETRRIKALDSSDPDFKRKLCEILGVDPVSGAGSVAFTQEDLVKLLEKEPDIKEIHLFGERFALPEARKRTTYIGVNHPQVYISRQNKVAAEQAEIFDDWEQFQPELLWRSLAEQGNAIAQNELGNCFYAAENYQEAFAWHMRAAEQGLVQGQAHVGQSYLYGKGVEKNEKQAVEWYRRAAEQGDAEAQYNLAECYRAGKGVDEDLEEAFKWFFRAAEQGYTDAQCTVGNFYYHGYGVKRNRRESFNWYRKAAGKGDDWAHYMLVVGYRDGEDVDEDPKEAFKWFHEVAEQGYIWAQYNLAKCYRDGKGVDKDQKQAFNWFMAAAKQGYADVQAQYQVGRCYFEGRGVEKNPAEAFRWFMGAAELGYGWAQYDLAKCYLNGWGVPINADKAKTWFQKAYDQGIEPARLKLLELDPKRFGLAEVLLYAIGGTENLLPGVKIDRSTGKIQLSVNQRDQVRKDILREYGAKDVRVEPVYYEHTQENWAMKYGEVIGCGLGVLVGGPAGMAVGGAAAHIAKKTLKKKNMFSPKHTIEAHKTKGNVYVVLDKIDAEMEVEFKREIVC